VTKGLKNMTTSTFFGASIILC